VIDNIPFAADDFLGGTELMVKAMLKGYQVDEFPAALHPRMFGVSKAKLLKTIVSHLEFQSRLVLHRLHIRSLFAE
jgi:dolichol-phosphate mannosyltransferase